MNQKVAVHLLEKLGYAADVVANGLEAVAALRRIPYPVVLMDCQMPELDGYGATAAIRQWEQDQGSGRHTPIIAMTAGAMAGDRERCLAAGMDDYISKPVRGEELQAVLARWLPGETAPAPSVSSTDGGDGIDRRVLEKLGDPAQGGDPAFLRELVTMFLKEAPSLLGAMRSAAAQGDASQVAARAHTLKGSSAYVGGLTVQALCEQLEAMARAGMEGAIELVDKVERAVAELQEVLELEAQRWPV